MFDRDFVKFTAHGLSVHVGSAMLVELQAGEQCPPGDGPEGVETTLVVIAEP